MRIKLNSFFILFLLFSLYEGFILQTAILFASVLVHELGHVLAARKINIKVDEIMLFPFGGVAKMEDLTKYGGYSEVFIGVAGPIVSGILIVISVPFVNNIEFFSLCFKCNMGLFFFNLIPALPMDGGRIIRNFLLSLMSYKQATQIMAYAGRTVALLLVLYNIHLAIDGGQSMAYVIVAIFIYAGTTKELRFCSYYYLLNKNNQKTSRIKRNKIRQRVINVYLDTPLRFIVSSFSPGNYCIINVQDNRGRIIRVFKEADMMNAFLKYGYDAKVEDIWKK